MKNFSRILVLSIAALAAVPTMAMEQQQMVKKAKVENEEPLVVIIENEKELTAQLILECKKKVPDLDKIKLLVEKGAKVNGDSVKRSLTPLMYVSKRGKIEIVKFLLSKGADINACRHGVTPLIYASIYASKYGHVDLVKYLLSEKADVDKKNLNGETALLIALRYKELSDVIDILLKNGAKTNQVTKDNETILMCAAQGGYYHLVEDLLKNGANPNQKTKAGGYTALMFASRNQHLEIVKILLKYGADVNAQNQEKDSALLLTQCPIITMVLLENGADPNVTNNHNVTKLNRLFHLFSGTVDTTDIIKLLLEKGAKPNNDPRKLQILEQLEAPIKKYNEYNERIKKLPLSKMPLVDPRKSLVDPRKSLVDPRKSLVDPRKSLVDPRKSLVDPRKSLVDPRKPLVDPEFSRIKSAVEKAKKLWKLLLKYGLIVDDQELVEHFNKDSFSVSWFTKPEDRVRANTDRVRAIRSFITPIINLINQEKALLLSLAREHLPNSVFGQDLPIDLFKLILKEAGSSFKGFVHNHAPEPEKEDKKENQE